jgi:predicted PhzF superfamily epimerase YddE/YHI9
LAAYVWKNARELVSAQDGEGLKDVDIEVVQGLKTGRECLMKVMVGRPGAVGSIELSGTGVLVADGNIVVPLSDIVF